MIPNIHFFYLKLLVERQKLRGSGEGEAEQHQITPV